jgi:general secretion pathway protein G
VIPLTTERARDRHNVATNSSRRRGSMQMNRPPSILEYHAKQRNRQITLRNVTIGNRLIDFLLVASILTISVWIAVPTYSSGRSSKVNAAKATISMVNQALENFHGVFGRYPTTAEGLSILVNRPPAMAGWTPFMEKMPLDPWGNPIRYSLKADGTCQFYSLGADQQDGTADDMSREAL